MRRPQFNIGDRVADNLGRHGVVVPASEDFRWVLLDNSDEHTPILRHTIELHLEEQPKPEWEVCPGQHIRVAGEAKWLRLIDAAGLTFTYFLCGGEHREVVWNGSPAYAPPIGLWERRVPSQGGTGTGSAR